MRRALDARRPGALTAGQLDELFALRRRAPETWTPAQLAERFEVREDDVRALLRFTALPQTQRDADSGRQLGYWPLDELQEKP